ncbi:Uu.00g077740.m01.CDS01 [Anthostomella pinea]|uniref:Uu.00g077740.m01.CDS01 n=1 Tax=Anthostomella pinea TaxID=933095 RepID=A0AAI8YJ69_9PEZI|nr:Uu.00g077740.m01.CDS01 [Anthostomella pinea]
MYASLCYTGFKSAPQSGIIPPNALFEKINADIDVDFYHTAIPTENIAWPTKGLRRVSVNSFGFGGSNTHVVLDNAYHYLRDRELIGNNCTVPGATVQTPTIADEVGHTSGTVSHIKANGINGMNGASKANGTNGHHIGTNGTNGNLNGTSEANGACGYNSTNGTNGTPNTNGAVNGSHHSNTQASLLVFSAANEKGLERTIEGYVTFYKTQVAGHSDKLSQLAYTLAARRSSILWRTFAVATGEQQVLALGAAAMKPVRTSAEAEGWPSSSLVKVPNTPIWVLSFWNELSNTTNIDKPEYSQPLSAALQIALVELLKSFGVVPKAVIRHSSGEIAAAYAIGALSLHSACKVSFFRGQLAGGLKAKASTTGAIMSVNLPQEHVVSYLEAMDVVGLTESINIACINSPLNCTLSGTEWAIDTVREQLDKDGIFVQKLKTGVAYHSPFMSIIADEYRSQLGTLEASKSQRVGPSVPMVSSVTGRAVRSSLLTTAQYWVDNMVSPVRFTDAVQILTQDSATLKVGLGSITDLVEIGPHCVLRRPIQDTIGQAGNRKKQVRYASVLYRSKSAIQSTLELLGHLFCDGHTVSIAEANHQSPSQKPAFLVDCPEYPFDHSHVYWAESRLNRDFRLREPVSGDTLGSRFYDWNPLKPTWRNLWSVETTPWLGDHVVSDTIIYPAAGILVMAMKAVQQMADANRVVSGYYIKKAQPLIPIVKHYEKESLWSDIKIFARYDDRWTECFRASVRIQYVESDAHVDGGLERRLTNERIASQYKRATEACTEPIDSKMFYQDIAGHGIRYGDWFQLLENIRYDGDGDAKVVARVDVSTAKHQTNSLVHPAILDAAFHALRVSATKGLSTSSATRVPMRLLDSWFSASGWQQPHTSSIRYMTITSGGAEGESKEGTIYALDDNLSPLSQADPRARDRPLSVIFDSSLAETFYTDMFLSICDHRLQKILDLASHENPKLRILEVGAGTGGMTSHVLSALQQLEAQSGGLKFSNYTYTDISPTFFESAANKWQNLKERVTFKTFNLERSAEDQGLELCSYDLVVAGSVLHATTDLAATIRNVRKTLKPGGHLILLEAIAPEKVITNFVFGLAGVVELYGGLESPIAGYCRGAMGWLFW